MLSWLGSLVPKFDNSNKRQNESDRGAYKSHRDSLDHDDDIDDGLIQSPLNQLNRAASTTSSPRPSSHDPVINSSYTANASRLTLSGNHFKPPPPLQHALSDQTSIAASASSSTSSATALAAAAAARLLHSQMQQKRLSTAAPPPLNSMHGSSSSSSFSSINSSASTAAALSSLKLPGLHLPPRPESMQDNYEPNQPQPPRIESSSSNSSNGSANDAARRATRLDTPATSTTATTTATAQTLNENENKDSDDEKENIVSPLFSPSAKSPSQFTPISLSNASELVSTDSLCKLIRATPARYHLNSWSLIYSMTRDGVSFKRFLELQNDQQCSILVIKDMQGKRFGCFASQPWRSAAQCSSIYYGTGESFVWEIQVELSHGGPRQSLQQRLAYLESTGQAISSSKSLSMPTVAQQKAAHASAPPSVMEIAAHAFSVPVSPKSADGTHASSAPSGPHHSYLAQRSQSLFMPAPTGQQQQRASLLVTNEFDELVHIYHWSGCNDYLMFTSDNFIAMGGGESWALLIDNLFLAGQTGESATFENPQLTFQKDFKIAELEVWAPQQRADGTEVQWIS